MEQRDFSDVVVRWSAALDKALENVKPHVPPEVFDDLTRATGDLLDGLATRAMRLSYHAPMPEEARLEFISIATALRTSLERITDEKQRRSEVDDDLQHQIDQHGDRLELLEERNLDAREAGE